MSPVTDENQIDIIEAFYSTSRDLDDLLTYDNMRCKLKWLNKFIPLNAS